MDADCCDVCGIAFKRLAVTIGAYMPNAARSRSTPGEIVESLASD